jgi:hypothetical protein
MALNTAGLGSISFPCRSPRYSAEKPYGQAVKREWRRRWEAILAPETRMCMHSLHSAELEPRGSRHRGSSDTRVERLAYYAASGSSPR